MVATTQGIPKLIPNLNSDTHPGSAQCGPELRRQADDCGEGATPACVPAEQGEEIGRICGIDAKYTSLQQMVQNPARPALDQSCSYILGCHSVVL